MVLGHGIETHCRASLQNVSIKWFHNKIHKNNMSDEKYKNKYRIDSARLKGWDYSWEGSYFITICTTNREHLFGNIHRENTRIDALPCVSTCVSTFNNKMHLSEFGEIVLQEWNKSFEMRAELFCDNFIIMPNHIHAIVRIEKPQIVETHIVETHGSASPHLRPISAKKTNEKRDMVLGHGFETHCRASLQNIGIAYRSPKSISSFVAGFKPAVTKRINKLRNSPKQPVWQTRFHDRIIRDNIEYQSISDYIINNPSNWEKDDFYTI